MIKILHLMQTSGPGGAENVLLTLVRNLSRPFLSIAVGLLREGWLSRRLRALGFPVVVFPASDGPLDFSLIRHIVNFVRANRIDLIHSHLLDLNFYSCIGARLARVRHVATEHGDVHHFSKKMDAKAIFKARVISKFSNRLVFVSKFTKRQFLKFAFIPESKSCVVYNGIDLDTFKVRQNINDKKEELRIDPRHYVIGNVANLYPVKGQTYLLRALHKVREYDSNFIAVFAGRGPLQSQLQREANMLGLRDHVRFLGFREDTVQLLTALDLFVLPSLSEGMPVALVEAMASGIPTVASDVGGIPEIIEDGKTGFLVPTANADLLAEKILDLMHDKTLSRQFALNAYEKVKACFTVQSMVNRYQEIYTGLTRSLPFNEVEPYCR